MKKKSITTSILLDTRIKNKENIFPLRLRIIYDRKAYYYTIRNNLGQSIYLSKLEFSKMNGRRVPDNLKELKIFLNTIEEEARKIIEKILSKGVFSFQIFKEHFYQEQRGYNDAIYMLRLKAQNLRQEERIATAVSNEYTANSLSNYIKKNKLPFDNITPLFLKNYENFMLKEGNSITTVGIYLRNLRAVFNEAIKEGIIPANIYPFGSDKYVIPTGKNIKKALTLSEIKKIWEYPCQENEERFRDYWFFCYLCNGINIKDMAKLKYSNIEDDIISLRRAKTLRETRRTPRLVTIVITQPIGKIIDKWGNKNCSNDDYIFPILKKGMSPEEELKAIQLTVGYINKCMKKIAKKLEISHNITTYTARHSFATILKHSGASIEFISESLGHANVKTTESYLADFEIEAKKYWAEKLMNFDKK